MIGIKNVIAIICGGGPAPGINSVISAVVVEATRHGWDVLGIYDGFSRLARGEKNYVRLEPASISRIHLTGGCILKMSRFNPTKKESDLRTVVETLTELGVTHVVTIGGDDTAFSSTAISEYARRTGRTINVVHVPKTIDNDLPLPEGVPTFGFETARAFGTMEIENLMEDASTTNNRFRSPIIGHISMSIISHASPKQAKHGANDYQHTHPLSLSFQYYHVPHDDLPPRDEQPAQRTAHPSKRAPDRCRR